MKSRWIQPSFFFKPMKSRPFHIPFFFTKWNLVSRIPSFFVSLKWNLVGYIHIFYLKLMKSRPFHIPFFHKMMNCKMKSHPTKTQLFSIPQMKSRWLQLYIFSQTNEISSVPHAFFSCEMKSRFKMKSHPTKTQLFSILRMKSHWLQPHIFSNRHPALFTNLRSSLEEHESWY